MTMEELRRRGFSRMEEEKDSLHRLECEALEEMNEAQRHWLHQCIRDTRERIHGMMFLMYALGAYDWSQKG